MTRVKHRPKIRRRKPSLVTIAKQAAKAGLEVTRYDIAPDGTISVVTGKAQQPELNAFDQWKAKHDAH